MNIFKQYMKFILSNFSIFFHFVTFKLHFGLQKTSYLFLHPVIGKKYIEKVPWMVGEYVWKYRGANVKVGNSSY